MVRTLATAVMALDEEIARTNALIEARFREHAHAAAITSMPGMGSLLGAEFIACTGGNLDAIGSSRRLAGIAGLAPVPKDSGRISGNMRRPHRYHRRLLRAFYLSAQVAARCCPTSRTFYERKRSEVNRTSRLSSPSPSPGAASTSCEPSYAISGPSPSSRLNVALQRHSAVTVRYRSP